MFKRMYQKTKAVVTSAATYVAGAVGAVAASVVGSPAEAALDVSTIAFDITPIETIGALMIAAVAAIWIIKRVRGFSGGN